MTHIICVKWGTKYDSKYVNILKNMCDRQVRVPFTFHCLTEDPTGIREDINIINLPNLIGIKSWWSKLYMFSPDLPIKEGTILYFDLDVVIFRNIDHIVNWNPDKFCIIRDFNRCRVPSWNLSNSSVMKWKAGTLNYLWNDFSNNPTNIMNNNHGDQDYITRRAKQDITHWPDEWIRSYKWEMIGRKDTKIKNGQKIVFQHPPTVTKENCVAVFHGKPNPHECGDQLVLDNWK